LKGKAANTTTFKPREKNRNTFTGASASEHPALMLIDFQVDFLADDGRMPVDRNQVLSVLAATPFAMEAAHTARDQIIAVGNEFRRSDYLMNLLPGGASVEGSTVRAATAGDALIPPSDRAKLILSNFAAHMRKSTPPSKKL